MPLQSETLRRRPGYITIQTGIDDLLGFFKKNKLTSEGFFFVDAITATKNIPPLKNNCIFVSSPSALTEMRVAYISLYQDKNRDAVFFDRVSGLTDCLDSYSITKFVHNMILSTHSYNGRLVLFTYSEDSQKLIEDISMFADKVIEL